MATVLKGRFVYNLVFRNSARILSSPQLCKYNTEVGKDVHSKDKELKVVYEEENVSIECPFMHDLHLRMLNVAKRPKHSVLFH